MLLFDLGHRLHPLEALRTFHVMGEHDAAPRVVGPEADVPLVRQAVDLKALPYPVATEFDQRTFARPGRKLQRRARADRGRVKSMAQGWRNQTFDVVVGAHRGRRMAIILREILLEQQPFRRGL